MESTIEKKCSAEGCKGVYRAKGYCDRHYKKWRDGELPHSRYKTCAKESCRKKRHQQSSLCEEHFNEKHGKKETAPAVAPPAAEAPPPPAA